MKQFLFKRLRSSYKNPSPTSFNNCIYVYWPTTLYVLDVTQGQFLNEA